MTTYRNTDERYGGPDMATIEHYQQLNPGGNFTQDDMHIYEDGRPVADQDDGEMLHDILPDLDTAQFNRLLAGAVEFYMLIGDSGGEYTLEEAIVRVFKEAQKRGLAHPEFDDPEIDRFAGAYMNAVLTGECMVCGKDFRHSMEEISREEQEAGIIAVRYMATCCETEYYPMRYIFPDGEVRLNDDIPF